MEVSNRVKTPLRRLAALAGVLLLLILIVNLSWFDEELHPDLARLIPPQPVSMEDNAFPLIYGFLAANDRNPRAAGMEIIEALRERFAAGELASLTADEIDDMLGNPDPAAVWNALFTSTACNSRFEIDCASPLIAEIQRVRDGNTRLDILLDRFEQILTTSRFEEHQEYDAYTPLPSYGPLLPISRIRLALAFRDGSTRDFLNAISQDIRFWKTMLRDGQSLVAKMIALAGLRNDTQFLSALLRDRALSPEEIAAIGNILTPLSEEERDIGETFLAEARIALLSDKSYAVFIEGPSALTRLALQENATLNESYYTLTMPLRFRAALSAPEYYRSRGFDDLSYDLRILPPPLYNLGGKIVLKWMSSRNGLTGYISRVHDTDGRIALVLLQAEILANPQGSIDSLVASSKFRNPYTLEPMEYDATDRTLSFECLGNSSDICAIDIGNRRR